MLLIEKISSVYNANLNMYIPLIKKLFRSHYLSKKHPPYLSLSLNFVIDVSRYKTLGLYVCLDYAQSPNRILTIQLVQKNWAKCTTQAFEFDKLTRLGR